MATTTPASANPKLSHWCTGERSSQQDEHDTRRHSHNGALVSASPDPSREDAQQDGGDKSCSRGIGEDGHDAHARVKGEHGVPDHIIHRQVTAPERE